MQFRAAGTGFASSAAGTSVRIPANLFTGGEYFALELAESRSPADYAAGALTPSRVPYELTTTWSGVFRLNATCGDGRVDPGEDCDTGGESASGNADFTRPRCGDTHRNSAGRRSLRYRDRRRHLRLRLYPAGVRRRPHQPRARELRRRQYQRQPPPLVAVQDRVAAPPP